MLTHMAGYSGTPLAKKLGLREEQRVLVVNEPPGFRSLVGPVTNELQFVRRIDRNTDVMHLFTTSRSELAGTLERWRGAMRADAVIWVSWPKKTSKVATDVTEDVVRDVALPLGLVDVKVCAVDDTWSGLKLVIRKELR